MLFIFLLNVPVFRFVLFFQISGCKFVQLSFGQNLFLLLRGIYFLHFSQFLFVYANAVHFTFCTFQQKLLLDVPQAAPKGIQLATAASL